MLCFDGPGGGKRHAVLQCGLGMCAFLYTATRHEGVFQLYQKSMTQIEPSIFSIQL
jgi:hypothetical protein